MNVRLQRPHPARLGVLVGLCAGLILASPAGAARVTVQYTAGLTAGDHPQHLAYGPDGNIWFTEQGPAPGIGRITPTGTITEYHAGLQVNNTSAPVDIIAGRDGNLWFTDQGPTPAVGRITPAGVITEFTAGLQAAAASCPASITAGADSTLWFTDQGSDCHAGTGVNAIGKITAAGQITEYTTGLQARNLSRPQDLTLGPGGNIWFTDAGSRHLGDADLGNITSQGAISEQILNPKSVPIGITLGPDGAVWFSDQGATAALGRRTPAGTVTEFSVGLDSANQSQPGHIIVGPDQSLWFTDAGATPSIGRITTTGLITEYPLGVAGAHPTDLIADPQGNLWYADSNAGIGKVALQMPPQVSTGPGANITEGSAIVTGTVNPLGSAVRSVAIDYGPTPKYGTTAYASPSTLPAGAAPVPIRASLVGLAAGTTIHYRVVATNGFGTTAGPDATLTTLRPASNHPPVLSRTTQTHGRWREGNRAASIASRNRPPIGTSFRVWVSELSDVAFKFRRVTHNRRKAGCGSRRHAKRCTILSPAGTLTLPARSGLNRVSFDGVLSPRARLPLGTYQVSVTAKAGRFRSRTRTLTFTIVR